MSFAVGALADWKMAERWAGLSLSVSPWARPCERRVQIVSISVTSLTSSWFPGLRSRAVSSAAWSRGSSSST